MKYELAKKLKEAGFPQREPYCWEEGGSKFAGYSEYSGDYEYIDLRGDDAFSLSESDSFVYDPTLEELISECGSEFKGFERDKYGRFCTSYFFNKEMSWHKTLCFAVLKILYKVKGFTRIKILLECQTMRSSHYDTKEEAVANLWLIINKK